MTAPHSVERLRFGPFELSGATGEILKDGMPLKLQPQPFRVLRLLVSRPGELIGREEIQDTLWADGTTVEFDQGLNYCIRQIRAALNDDAREPRFIETVPKRGYRFIAPVDAGPSVETGLAQAEAPSQSANPRPRPMLKWWWAATAAAAIVAVVVAFTVVQERELPSSLRPPKDQYTYNLYLEAVHLGELWEAPSAAKSISNFREVIHRAPEFAPAYVGLSNVLTQSGKTDVLAESESLARQALAKNNAFGPAHAALAHSYWRQWKWDDADKEFRKALDLDANDAVAHQLFGLYLVSAGKDAREAVEHGMRAIQIEPTSGLKNHTLGNIYLQTHQYDLAIQQEMKTLEIFPRFPQAYERIGSAYLMKGMIREAAEALDKGDSYGGQGPVSHVKLLIRMGRLQEARSLLDKKRPYRTNSLAYAGVMASLGDISGAFEVLNEAVTRHEGSLIWIKTMTELDVLRSDERYRQVLTHMGFN